jgi:lysophospholipase L1-like esterase
MNWETYIAFGDSITIGARTYLGYPEQVADILGRKLSKQWNAVNHAVSGYKAVDLARHIDLHFSALQIQKASISTILIGTNDLKEKTSPDDFAIALNQVILKVRLLTMGENVVIFSIPEFHPGVMYPYSIELNETLEHYNEIIAKLAIRHNIRVLTLNHTSAHFTDGVHLNREGTEHFSLQISRFILKDRGIDLG